METHRTRIDEEEVVAITLAHRKGHEQEYAVRLIGPDTGQGLRREFAERIPPGTSRSGRRGKATYVFKVSDLPALVEVQEPVAGIHNAADRPYYVFMMSDGSYENVPFVEIAHFLPKQYDGDAFRIVTVSGVTMPLPDERGSKAQDGGS